MRVFTQCVITLEESPALVLHLCTSVQKGRVKGSPPTSKSSDFVVLPFVVKGVLLSLHIRFLNTGSVLPPTSRVTFTTWLRYKQLWLKSIDFFCGKLPIVLLDKTLITPLGLCRALLSSIETAVWTFNPSTPLYGEKSWTVFLKKRNFFLTEKRKMWTSWMTWGWVNY